MRVTSTSVEPFINDVTVMGDIPIALLNDAIDLGLLIK